VTVRRLAAVVGAAVIALTLSGCVLVKNVSSSQLNTIGNVQIAATICVSGTTNCTTPASNSGVDAGNNNQNVQLFVAYRVSAGATPPATLRFFDDDGIGPLFTPNASYTAELNRLAPPPAGTQWFGYTSTLLNWLFASSPQSAAIITSFGLPPAASGTPFTGPLQYQVVAGTRAIDATHPITAPVACGNSATNFNSTGSDGQTVCIDSPVPASIGSSISQATRDIAVRPGGGVAAAPGAIAGVPFSLQFAGAASASALFGLTATTTIPGATPVVSPATLTPTANSTTPALVSVPVPAGTAPGTYPVTLTATIAGQTRSGASSITIPGGGGAGAAAAAGVKLSQLSITPKSINRFRRAKPATLTVTLGQGGTLRVVAARSAKGRRNANGVCVAPRRRLIAQGAAKCTRFLTVTTINRPGLAAGVQTVTFSGRGRVPGLYRLTATLRSAGLISPPLRITVTVNP
jgi:hypothetical protein